MVKALGWVLVLGCLPRLAFGALEPVQVSSTAATSGTNAGLSGADLGRPRSAPTANAQVDPNQGTTLGKSGAESNHTTVGADLGRPSAAPVSATAVPVSSTVATGPGFEQNHPVEDFFTITVVSIPFTALWTLVGASIVGGISQHKYPPEFDQNMIIGAGAVALGASVSIGLVSVFWGKGQGKAQVFSTNPQGH